MQYGVWMFCNTDMKKILITTVPFGDKNVTPIELLNSVNVSYTLNPIGRKLTEDELCQLIPDFNILIAGTEKISKKVLRHASKLELISRVGVGLDSVDLMFARKKNISVSYTPEAPVAAVADLTIGLMISLLRSIHLSNLNMHQDSWKRYFGKRITECVIGVVGAGRIGLEVIRLLNGLGVKKILLHEICPIKKMLGDNLIEFVTKQELLSRSDIITLHIPGAICNIDFINSSEIDLMKHDAYLINTSRGGVVNEFAIFDALSKGRISGAAIDVFVDEPYKGRLSSLNNCILTSHMGSMSYDCRARMEIEATQEVIRFINGEPLRSIVPAEEYEQQKMGIG